MRKVVTGIELSSFLISHLRVLLMSKLQFFISKSELRLQLRYLRQLYYVIGQMSFCFVAVPLYVGKLLWFWYFGARLETFSSRVYKFIFSN